MRNHRIGGGVGRRSLLAGAGALAAGLARMRTQAQAQTQMPVDLSLVLAVDVSGSVTEEEAQLQRDGYRGAMTDTAVLTAIGNGTLGAIAVAYAEWANYQHQDLVIPWTRIATRSDAQAWADRLDRAPHQSVYGTSLSGALAFAGTLLAADPFEPTRRVVDVSGDGANNNGPPAEIERDRLVAAGVTINGLPIINRHPRFSRVELNVDKYYAASVIGGPGAFLIVAENFEDFADAIRRKLVQEIASRSPDTLAG